MRANATKTLRSTPCWVVGFVVLMGWTESWGQSLPNPPAPSGSVPAPSNPVVSVAPIPAPAGGPVTVDQLAERLRMMEEVNRALLDRLEKTTRDQDAQIKQLMERVEGLSNPAGERPAGSTSPAAPNVPPADRPDIKPTEDLSAIPDYTEGQFSPNAPPPEKAAGFPLPSAISRGRKPLYATFGPGFRFETEEADYRLQVHLESQIEGRVWGPSGRLPDGSGISGIYLPRQRIFFDGNITKKIEYELSINRGLGNINILNAYINLHFDDRFQVRFGRFFTPFPYDQYAISNYWMPTPERSMFTTNVGLNRQFGLKLWGYLLKERLDYAAGLFNGSRNSFENTNNAVDFVGYLNARPFQESELLPFLRFLNLGTSVAYGYQDQGPVPFAFRIGAGSPDANIPGSASVPFLVLNRDTVERGDRLLGSVHAAYFYKGLSVIGEWQYGHAGYASTSRPGSVRVPYSGFYVSTGYFLTGENVQRRTRLYPLRPFLPTSKDQIRGAGAWEVVARYSTLSLGDQIFRGGFADPALWASGAGTTELGVNWYWNEYIKLYTFWLHGQFSDSIAARDGGRLDSADMFWMRFQLYY